MPKSFKKVIGNPDAVVVFTATCSHKMMETAVKEAKRQGISVVRSHSSSLSSLQLTLERLEADLKLASLLPHAKK